ncbi:pleiotropic drug resistance ABC transporter [Auriculariales sp. MPI-PUGE-AT-0066]|nr:pleiotropic drug resistance ABC transporter [Auriculariales sp. MPI-PUGE-AT-0066]
MGKQTEGEAIMSQPTLTRDMGVEMQELGMEAGHEVKCLSVDDEKWEFSQSIHGYNYSAQVAGIKQRSLGVLFRDLRVVVDGSTAALHDNVGDLFNPLVMAEKIGGMFKQQQRNIISGFEGVVKPGEMLLVLGRPGSGCSTILKTLANQRSEYRSVLGDVHYDSLSPEQVEKKYRGDVVYCPEDDIHFPSLSVKDTFDFAAKTRTPHLRPNNWSREDMVSNLSKTVGAVLGLRHTYNTMVGDATIRGVSGGEKKRVSIGEILMARATIHCWDNTTRGLDASTALEFTRAIRNSTDGLEQTTIAAFYQASENMYDLFDKVCVVYEGKMAYFGPADKARQYFIDLGFEPANRQTTPDFLVAVTDPLSRIPRDNVSTAPTTAEQFSAAFKQSQLGDLNRKTMSDYEASRVGNTSLALAYKESAEQQYATGASKSQPYITSLSMQVQEVFKRRIRIMRGQFLFQAINAVVFVIMGILIGTLFWQTPNTTTAYFSRGSILFFTLLFPTISSMAEIRQSSNSGQLFDARCVMRTAALTLVDIPISFVTTFAFVVVLYFFTGLGRTAAQFFINLLIVFCTTFCMKLFYRAVSAAFKAEPLAQALSGIAVQIMLMYTGYTVPSPTLVSGLRWVLWVNPMRYGFEAIMANEFRTLEADCSQLIPSGPLYDGVDMAHKVCATVGATPGQSTVNGLLFLDLAYDYSYGNVWRNFGIIIAWIMAFLLAFLIFSEYNTDVALSNVGRSALELDSRGPLVAQDPTVSSLSTDIALRPTSIFTWSNVSYTVPISKDENRQLLDDVSGFVAPGKLTALMGESGAGKTTLLNVLAQRVTTGAVSGDMLVDGQPLPLDFQAQTGYCQQMDVHLPQQTVQEAVIFSAKLRQPRDVPAAEKEAYALQCLKMCGLENHAFAIIGTLNAEMRKRTTIAVELAAKPKLLLFLDEPTSGLDSQSAWAILLVLRSLAERGQAILCTIHQPSAELFQSFDRVLLLQKGGKTTYFGDIGPSSSNLIQYFERGGARQCLPAENPAEYMLEVIGAGATAHATQDWHKIWLQSSERDEAGKELNEIHAKSSKTAVNTKISGEYATTWFYQLGQNLARLATEYWRDTPYIMAKLALSAIGGLLVGVSFFQAGDSQQETQNKSFAVWMALILGFPMSNLAVGPWIKVRTIYEIRERPSRIYSWTALVTAQILIEMPLNIICMGLTFVTWFWTVGFDISRAGFTALVLVVGFPLYFQSLAQAMAAVSPSFEIGGLLFSTLFNLAIAFCGLMQPYAAMGWWQWMYRVSPLTYVLEAMVGYNLGHTEIHCLDVEFVTINPPTGQTCTQYLDPYMTATGGYLRDGNATGSCQYCPVGQSDGLLASTLNIYYDNHWRDFGIILAFVAFNISCIYTLTYLFRIRNK